MSKPYRLDVNYTRFYTHSTQTLCFYRRGYRLGGGQVANLQYSCPTLSIFVCFTVFDNEKDKLSLDTEKELVGGWVQLLPCPRHPDWQMLVNEEGKLYTAYPYNQEASDICCKDIVGHAVLLKGAAIGSKKT